MQLNYEQRKRLPALIRDVAGKYCRMWWALQTQSNCPNAIAWDTLVLKLILNYEFPEFVYEGIYFHQFFSFSIFISFLFFCLPLLLFISFLHFHSIFCGLIVSLCNFLSSSNVFSSFSVSFFPGYYNLPPSLSPILFFRYILFCFFICLSLFILSHSSIFLLYLYFCLSLALFCRLTLLLFWFLLCLTSFSLSLLSSFYLISLSFISYFYTYTPKFFLSFFVFLSLSFPVFLSLFSHTTPFSIYF